MAARSDPIFEALRPELESLLRRARRLKLIPTNDAPLCGTRFGGFPYRETRTWPQCERCHEPFSFLGQFDSRPVLDFDPGFSLAALYYCNRCRPHESGTNGRGFHLQTFEAPGPDKHVPFDNDDQELLSQIDEDRSLRLYRACAVESDDFRSFIDWEDWKDWGLDELESSVRDAPTPEFNAALRRWLFPLTRTRFGCARTGSTLFTYLGGHPCWVNGNTGYRALGGALCSCGRCVAQLIQLDTDEAAGFSFGRGAGLLNVFVCPAAGDAGSHRAGANDAVRLVHQCI